MSKPAQPFEVVQRLPGHAGERNTAHCTENDQSQVLSHT
jgi:hypothetical protein